MAISFTTITILAVYFNKINGQNVVTFPSTVVVAGENATLECSFTLTGRTYSDSYLIESNSIGQQFDTLVTTSTPVPGSRYSVESLTSTQVVFGISNTVRSDDGYYLCYIETDGGPDVSSTPAKLTIQYIGGKTTAEVNSNTTAHNVNITCFGTVDGDPVPDIKLYKDNNPIQTVMLPTTYTIDTVSEGDNGIYRCEANSIAGTVRSNTITLDYYKPRFNLEDEITKRPGETVTIELENFSANPNDITYQWMSGSDIIDTDSNPATFTFKVGEVDGENDTINVNVTNIIGSTSKSTVVRVSNIDGSLRIDVNNSTAAHNVTITCSGSINGFPAPDINLYKDDIIIITTTALPLTYTISTVSDDDSGTYRCEASNTAGTVTSNIVMLYYSDPVKPCECEETIGETGNNSPGLVIGMFFVGMFVGAVGLSIGFLMYTKTKQKQTTNKEKTEKKKQDTYMEYTVDIPTDGENQTYQDLQHKVEESAYVNVKTGNKNKGLKV